jgi:hypothetical protein
LNRPAAILRCGSRRSPTSIRGQSKVAAASQLEGESARRENKCAMFQISLRQLFILVAIAAAALVSLHHASELCQGLVGLFAMGALFTAVVVAIVDRGRRQMFAIAFATVMLGYALLVINGATYVSGQNTINGELNGWNGRLPTTVLLRALHSAIARERWVDVVTAKVLDDAEVARRQTSPGPLGAPSIETRKHPSLGVLVTTGHYWFALLFAYLGGHFARFVYLRRMKEHAASSKA